MCYIDDKHNGLVYCDCPGFFDNRGKEERICASLGIKRVIELSGGIQSIVFCLSKANLESTRGKIVIDMVDTLVEMFEDPFDHIPSIFMLFTKDAEDELEIYLDELEEILETMQNNNAENAQYNLKKAIWLLQGMFEYFSSKDTGQNFFSVNPLDKGLSREKITNALRLAPVIPKEKFGFVGTSTMKKNCREEFVKPFIHSNMSILKTLCAYHSKVDVVSQRIEMHEKIMRCIQEAKTGIKEENEVIQEIVTAYDSVLEVKNNEIQTLMGEEAELSKKIEEQDTDDPVQYEVLRYDEYETTWELFCVRKAKGSARTYAFSYHDLPFVRVKLTKVKGGNINIKEAMKQIGGMAIGGIVMDIAGVAAYMRSREVTHYEYVEGDAYTLDEENGYFHDENSNPKKGEYSICYRSPLHALGKAVVFIYVAKRVVHQGAIQYWKQKLQENQAEVARLAQDIQAITEKKDKQDIGIFMEYETMTKNNCQDTFKNFDQDCRKANQILRQYAGIFQAISTIGPLVNLQDELLIEFLDNYKKVIEVKD